MPRIPNAILDCAVYLYADEQAARDGEHAGGTGFLVGIESNIHRGLWWIYAVTNSHVIKDGYPVVRMNKREGGRGIEIDVLNLPAERWFHHPDGDDVAVCEVDVFGKRIKFEFLDVQNHFVDKYMPYFTLGPGDDVYMVGRLIPADHRGVPKNLTPNPFPSGKGNQILE